MTLRIAGLQLFRVLMNREKFRLFLAGALPHRQTGTTLAGSALAFALIAAAATAQAQPQPFQGIGQTFSNAGHSAEHAMSNAGHSAKNKMSNAGHSAKNKMSHAGHGAKNSMSHAVGRDQHRSNQPR